MEEEIEVTNTEEKVDKIYHLSASTLQDTTMFKWSSQMVMAGNVREGLLPSRVIGLGSWVGRPVRMLEHSWSHLTGVKI